MTSIANAIFRPPFRARLRGDLLAFDIVEPWYRSLPVSCVVGLAVQVDGKVVPDDDVTLEIGGVARTLGECAAAWESFWFVQDPAEVRVVTRGDLSATCQIEAQLTLRIPYIMVTPHDALPRHVSQDAVFEVVSR